MNTPESFWRRRVLNPAIALLKQGTTPDKLAQTFAAGFVCSMFPVVGTTSVLNLLVGLRLRLNHPLLQTLNQLLSPVHLVMIVMYIRLGEWIWGAHDDPLTVTSLIESCQNASWREFFDQFGMALVHACTAWAVTGPLFFVVLYYPCRRLFLAIAAQRRITTIA